MKNEELKSLAVVKSNNLVQKSKINLSIYEHRIINYMISQIKPTDTKFDYITIKYSDFCSLCGISNSNFFYTKQIITQLYNKSIVVFSNDENAYVPIKWIDDFKLNEAQVQIKFHPRMGEMLLNLLANGKYTQTELQTYFKFKLKYSPTLYDYFRSYVNLTFKNKVKEIERILSVADIREMTGLNIVSKNQKPKYPLFADIKKNVIDPALEEINNSSDIHVEYEIMKIGRKVDSLKFKIRVRDIAERFRAEALSERNKK